MTVHLSVEHNVDDDTAAKLAAHHLHMAFACYEAIEDEEAASDMILEAFRTMLDTNIGQVKLALDFLVALDKFHKKIAKEIR